MKSLLSTPVWANHVMESFSLPQLGVGAVIKKNAGNIISEAELTLLQFRVSWEITVSWTAANDY